MAPPPCRAIDRWTAAGLVAAFFDLALAGILLSAASLAFVASSFLSFFALRLPCTCNHGRRPCIQRRLLVDGPRDKIAAVHAAIRRRFPFRRREEPYCWVHSECCCCYCSDFDFAVSSDGDARVLGQGKMIEFGGKVESCGSVESVGGGGMIKFGEKAESCASGESDSGGDRQKVDLIEGIDRKGKGILRRRRKRGKNLIHDSPQIIKLGWQEKEGEEQAVDAGLESKDSVPELAVFVGNNEHFVEEVDSGPRLNLVDDVNYSTFGHKGDSVGELNEPGDFIKNLKQALEEEQSSRAALLLELEKERSAAATAADEAMGMIFKLQEQKALLEMEARQYQRLVEEKSAYDEEEMGILKEIIIRREMEKHILEKQVKEYHLQGNEEDDFVQQPLALDLDDGMEVAEENTFDSSSSPDLLLKEVDVLTSEVITEKGTMQSLGNFESLEKEHASYSGNVEENRYRELSDHQNEYNVEEKGMVAKEVNPYPIQNQSSGYWKESGLLHKSISDSICVGGEESGKDMLGDSLENVHGSYGSDLNKQDSKLSQFDSETTVLDVHVIDNRLNDGDQRNKNQMELPPKGSSSGTSLVCGIQNEIVRDMEQEISRSYSDMIRYTKPMDNPIRHASWSDLRRSLLPEIEVERSRLEKEVELLSKRLVLVQQGRERLKLSVEQKEKEKHHIRLLEDIASQLQEISKATGNGKGSDHSLSPSASVVNLKKRRCQSSSMGRSK